MDSIALLVIDFQEAFSKVIPGYEALVSRCCFAVEVAQLLEIPCIYTEYYSEKLKATTSKLLDAGLRENGKCFGKKAFSALSNKEVVQYIHSHNINHLLVGGIEASVCVHQTLIDGLKEGLGLTLLSDCIGGRRKEDTCAVIAAWQSMGCHRLPSETVFYSVLKSAEHPKFSEFTQIVKKYS